MEDLMDIWWIIIPVIAAIAFYIYWTRYREKKPSKEGVKTTAPGIVLPSQWTGGQYQRLDGGWFLTVHRIPPDKLAAVTEAIDRGLRKACSTMKLRNPAWTRGMLPEEVPPILFIEPMDTNMDGSPALEVGGHKTAGTVINVHMDLVERGVPMIVIADQGAPGFNWAFLDYLAAAVRHEWEHGGEWLNDKNIFLRYIGPNDVHPHWLDADGSLVQIAGPVNCLPAIADGPVYDIHAVLRKIS